MVVGYEGACNIIWHKCSRDNAVSCTLATHQCGLKSSGGGRQKGKQMKADENQTIATRNHENDRQIPIYLRTKIALLKLKEAQHSFIRHKNSSLEQFWSFECEAE
ncbi:unnamed protein product [Acanthoscelides obtectus]|uniref:Uncharacterized protein n=1 Tax=Acanthoscelides obtectus TaxID=200917 RepID=A0A9P0NVT1_ACAOB|nr:unnamed protein product [Acanthoscelides obtectus]CAK1667965.1 hypothetical protein AOBTE_LOCUS26143 [Acanthoscelides obtectus]